MCKKSLQTLVKEYAEAKEQEKLYKPQIKSVGDEIKKQLAEQGLTKFASGKITVSVKETENIELNVPEAVAILKNKLPEEVFNRIVTYEPVIHQEMLDNAIYNGNISASDLEPAKVIKAPTVKLYYKVGVKK